MTCGFQCVLVSDLYTAQRFAVNRNAVVKGRTDGVRIGTVVAYQIRAHLFKCGLDVSATYRRKVSMLRPMLLPSVSSFQIAVRAALTAKRSRCRRICSSTAQVATHDARIQLNRCYPWSSNVPEGLIITESANACGLSCRREGNVRTRFIN